MKETKKKIALILILVIAGLFVFILIAGKTNITQIITPTYKLASTPYATLVYIGNGTAKVGGIAGATYTENITLNVLNQVTSEKWQYNIVCFPYNNITIDNKTFAIANESITINTSKETKQNIPLSSYASKNGTLYYIRLINFSKYYGVIIPANFMNKSKIAIPLEIRPYPTCPIISGMPSSNVIAFNNAFDNLFGMYNLYAYTGVIISKNSTGTINNNQYFGCVSIVEPAWLGGCSVNNVGLNCTYYNNYQSIVNENPVYPEIKVENTFLDINNHIKGVYLPTNHVALMSFSNKPC